MGHPMDTEIDKRLRPASPDDVHAILVAAAEKAERAASEARAETKRWVERIRLLDRRHRAAELILAGRCDHLLDEIGAVE